MLYLLVIRLGGFGSHLFLACPPPTTCTSSSTAATDTAFPDTAANTVSGSMSATYARMVLGAKGASCHVVSDHPNGDK